MIGFIDRLLLHPKSSLAVRIAVTAFAVAAAMAIAVPSHAELSDGSGSFEFLDGAENPDKPITVWYHKPKGTMLDLPVVFVMHGVKRNGERYRDNWVDLADKGKFLLVVPEFSKKHFPGSWRYNLGAVFRASLRPRPERDWAFTFIEKIFDTLRDEHGVTANQYDMFGHSAGSQFVHRMVLFKRGARIRRAIAANAGWYTMPDRSVEFPYGIASANVSDDHLREFLGMELIVLLGDRDTDPNHRFLRRSPEAMAQGKHRFERGHSFFEMGKKLAKELGADFKWRLEVVPGVAHSNRRMAPAAAEFVGHSTK